MRESSSERVFDILNSLFMLFLAFITIYPFWYVICGSFSDGNALMKHTGVLFWPKGYSLAAYKAAFNNKAILTGFGNTGIVLFAGVAVNLVVSSLGAFVLSRKDLYWNKFFMKLITVTMFFNGGLIPAYLLVANTLNMKNSLLVLIIPYAINTYNLIIMRTSFAEIPESLIESAELDGASSGFILARIVIPLSKSILAVMTLYYAVQHWNSWFPASIYLTERTKYPLQLMLREILIQNTETAMGEDAGIHDKYYMGETIKYAIIIITTVPILVVYPYLQRYFVKGVMVGAVKG